MRFQGAAMVRQSLELLDSLNEESSDLSPLRPSYRSRDRLLGMIVEEAANEIYVFDMETHALLLVNKKARRNVGYMQNEICTMAIDDLMDSADVRQLNDALKEIVGGAESVLLRCHHKRRDGSFYPVESCITIGHLDGRLIAFSLTTDKTATRRAEARARKFVELDRICSQTAEPAEIPQLAVDWLLGNGSWTLGGFVELSTSDGGHHTLWKGPAAQDWKQRDLHTLEAFVRAEGLASRQRRWLHNHPLERPNGRKLIASLLLAPLIFKGQSVGVFVLAAATPLTQTDLLIPPDEARLRLSQAYERRMNEEELAEARERLEAAVEGADTGLWYYNYRTGKFFLSERAQEILGVSRGYKMPDWAEFGSRLHPDDIEHTRRSMSRHAHHGAPYNVEYRYRLSDGEYIWLQVRGRGSWNKDGAIVRTAGTLVDISAEKEAEFLRRDISLAMAADTPLDQKLSTVLTKSAAFLRMPIGVLSHVSDGESEVLHSTVSEGPWRKGAAQHLKDTLSSDLFFADEVQAYPDLGASPLAGHPARTRMDVAAFIGAPVFVKGVRFGTLCFFSSKVKESAFSETRLAIVRLLAQWAGEEIGRAANLANLVASNALKSANLAVVADAVLTINSAGRIEDANSAACDLFGWTTEALRSMHIGELLPGAKAISTPEGGLLSVRARQDMVMRRCGERVTVLLHVSDVQLLDRTLSTVVVTDLTLVKQAESAKRDFVSVVSHELRTPLTSIRGALAVIEAQAAGPLPAAASNLIRIANRNSERLVRLVNDILDIDKLENGKFEVKLLPVSLAPIVRESVTANAAYADRFGVSYTSDLPAEDIVVIADNDRLLQVLANLLSNAAKFTRPGTSVSVFMTIEGAHVRVSVRDQGLGVPEELRPRLFEKFAQAQNVNTRDREGSGLGLSISRQLMHLMNGDIEYAFDEGVGSTFSLKMPIASTQTVSGAEGAGVHEGRMEQGSHQHDNE
jgi:PAS domain S-box-containing protein